MTHGDVIELIGVRTRLLPNAHANVTCGRVPRGGDHDFSAVPVPDDGSKIAAELWRELESPQANDGWHTGGT